MGFSEEQKRLLGEKLNASHVKPPAKFGPKGDYLEGWHVITEANRIFGFDGWSYEVTETKCVSEAARKIGSAQKDGWGVTYTAKVRVIIAGVMREDFGAGHGYDVDAGLAHESAIKESITDALKRALRTFGNPFGLALYDKTRENVETTAPDQPAKADHKPSKSDARPLFSELETAMRKNTTTGDLAGWWKSCADKRHALPNDWHKNLHDQFVALGFELKGKEDEKRAVVSDIEDTFPGSTVVDERVIRDGTGRELSNVEAA